MTAPANLPIELWLNEDFFVQFPLVDANDALLDLADTELLMQVRATAETRVLLELSTENGRLAILDPPVVIENGVLEGQEANVEMSLSHDDLRLLAAGTYVHGCVAIQGDERANLWAGSLRANLGVPR